jgi:hypothetical protein
MNSYHMGQVVRLSVAFTEDGAAVDPASVYLRILAENSGYGDDPWVLQYGVDAEIIKDSTGNYHMDYEITTAADGPGRTAYRWEGIGTHAGAIEAYFNVLPSEIYA